MCVFAMKLLILFLLVGLSHSVDPGKKKFPQGFLFGVSTSAYQIEGGWNQDGKGESVWDNFAHTEPSPIVDNSTGDVACDSYNRMKQDIFFVNDLYVDHYRFSISWSRILPTGLDDNINEAGVNYYKNLIKELKLIGVQPMVTLLHFDLPQKLQEMGGFLNDSIVDWFGNYSRLVYRLFGDDVKLWITINQPMVVCHAGYGLGSMPPRVQSEGILEYQCARNILRAHARAYHIYNEEFRHNQQGKVAISLNSYSYLPGSTNKEDIDAAERAQQFVLGMYAHPIFVGDWPEILKTRVALRSTLEGKSQSRLPAFTSEDIAYINGTSDFFGLNVYTAELVLDLGEEPSTENPPTRQTDAKINTFPSDKWENTSISTIKVVPTSIQPLLKWIKLQYNNPDVFITENGYPSPAGSTHLKDDRRMYYIQSYLTNIREVMLTEDINVLGYTVWSLMDTMEWTLGYTVKFGLYSVDFESPELTRKMKASAAFYKRVVMSRCTATMGCSD